MQHNKFDPHSVHRHEFYHSSGYADASATRNHFGATDSVSFNQRQSVDANRQVVDRYRGVRHIDTQKRYSSSYERRLTPLGQNRSNQTPPIQRTFTEPPRRSYNPYS